MNTMLAQELEYNKELVKIERSFNTEIRLKRMSPEIKLEDLKPTGGWNKPVRTRISEAEKSSREEFDKEKEKANV